jgi:hypothetical protein
VIETDLTAWPVAHARLALVEGGSSAPAPVLATARGRMGPVFYVAAARLERPPVALGRGPVVLVTPREVVPDAGTRCVFDVAGCVGFVPARTVSVSASAQEIPA